MRIFQASSSSLSAKSLAIAFVMSIVARPAFAQDPPPPTINSSIATAIEALPGVDNVHDLHVWAIEPRFVMLTCHVLVDGNDEGLTNALLRSIRNTISSQFGIQHITIQMETSCCHPAAVHCDLRTLTGHHRPADELHVHP